MIIPTAVVALMMSGASDLERERRLDIAYYSFETGCLIAHTKVCETSKCKEDALAYCAKNAKAFREWIKNG